MAKFTLYDYQKRIVRKQNKFMKSKTDFRGQIYAGTGAGKTVCFINLIERIFKKNPSAKICLVYPRIALADDQLDRVINDFVDDHKGHIEITNFHSGHIKEHTLLDRKNISTTNSDELVRIMNNTPEGHITFTTYYSLPKIAHLDFDLIVCDEGHYLTSDQFSNSLYDFGDNTKVLFYTATPIHVAANEECMSNVELFGNVLEAVAPSEVIKTGRIVPPKLIYVDAVSSKKGNMINDVELIGQNFKAQLDQGKIDNPGVTHKMLVAMSNTKRFPDIRDDISQLRELTELDNLDVYTVTANELIKNHGGKGNMWTGSKNRKEGLDDFKNNENPSILIHCDTVAEGVDISGICGVTILRGVTMSKAMQTIGRACRSEQHKTVCYVNITTVDGEYLAGKDLDFYAKMFRELGYDEIVEQMEVKADRGLGQDIDEYSDPDVVLDDYSEINIVAEHLSVFNDILTPA